jgi:dihydropteroate synthase
MEAIRFRSRTLDFARTYVMGVVNVTPDSFSDGGEWLDAGRASARGRALVEAGADIVDVGGESTRPGSRPVAADEQWRRVAPVIAELAARTLVSVDTCSAEVAERALAAGAELVNDVSGGALDAALLPVVARHGAAVILGHLRGTPATMAEAPAFGDVVGEVTEELGARIERAVAAGVARGRILIDPGLGFGKTARHNLELLGRLGELGRLGCPIVVGASRKSFLGQLTGRPAGERELATAAADAIAILHGAHVVRVHDVAAQIDAVRVADAVAREVQP